MYSELRVVLEPQATPAELLPELDNVLAVLGVDGVVLGDGDVRAPRRTPPGTTPPKQRRPFSILSFGTPCGSAGSAARRKERVKQK